MTGGPDVRPDETFSIIVGGCL